MRSELQPVHVRGDAGFAVFDVPPNAPAITAEDVVRAFDDE